MKKVWFFCAVLLSTGMVLDARELKGFTLGFGLEGNMNSRASAAVGGSLSACFGLNRLFSLGLKGTFSHNLGAVMTAEPEALFRYYARPLGQGAFFFQAGLGASLIFERGKNFSAPLGELSAGLRLPVGPLFFESSIRAGYPFIWGLGIAVVFRFGSSEPGDEVLRR